MHSWTGFHSSCLFIRKNVNSLYSNTQFSTCLLSYLHKHLIFLTGNYLFLCHKLESVCVLIAFWLTTWQIFAVMMSCNAFMEIFRLRDEKKCQNRNLEIKHDGTFWVSIKRHFKCNLKCKSENFLKIVYSSYTLILKSW